MLTLRCAAIRATIFIAAIFLFTYIALLLIVNLTVFQEWLKADLTQRTGYEVAGRLRLDPLLRLSLSAVEASKASKPVLQAERILIVITPFTFFSKTIHRVRLEKPILYLDLNELMRENKEPRLDLSLRHLNIADGTLVLKLGSGDSLDLKSLAMNAQNVNLGQATGLNLRADIPRLKGVVEVILASHESDKIARLRIEQQGYEPVAIGPATPRLRSALEAEIKLGNKKDESLSITAIGKLNGMLIGAECFSGHFDARADLGANHDAADIAARLVATELPSQIRFLPIALPKGTSTALLEGNFSVADKKMTLRSFRLQSPLGDASGAAVVDFTPEIAVSNGKIALRKVPLEPLKSSLPGALSALAAEGVFDADLELRGPWRTMEIRGTVQASGIQLRSEQFSLAALSFKTPVEWANSSFRAVDVEITGKKLLARQKSAMPLSAEELRINGMLEQTADAPLKTAGQIRVHQGRFASLDGTRVGEKLTLDGRFETTRSRDTGDTSIIGALTIEQGEVLWGKFFADLRSQRPALQFDGDHITGADTVRLRELVFTLATVGKIAARGAIEQTSKNPLLRLEINSDNIQPPGFFEFFIRPNLNRSFPTLDQLALGGRLGFTVRATGTFDNLAVAGTLQLRGGEVRDRAKRWQIGPIQLDLPFSILYPGASAAPLPANVPTGSLTVASARFGSEVILATNTALSLWNNALSFRQPIRLPIYGGVVEISGLNFQNLIENPQALALSLEAKSLQLDRLTEALGWYRLAGTLSGSIPKVEWAGDSLRSSGQIEVSLFGGRVQISKLEIESPFSSVPSIKLDALFRDISLEQASETFAFGQISGVLQGTVNELVMAAGQPSQFRADVHSVEKRAVSQRISVESLNKITVLSSGSDAGVLYGGIASFFDSFRYSKLGFKATLRNDKLSLRGVESRKDGEYLVVGSLIPPTVNVVSHTQTIAFSELLRRLERIQNSEKAEKSAN